MFPFEAIINNTAINAYAEPLVLKMPTQILMDEIKYCLKSVSKKNSKLDEIPKSTYEQSNLGPGSI